MYKLVDFQHAFDRVSQLYMASGDTRCDCGNNHFCPNQTNGDRFTTLSPAHNRLQNTDYGGHYLTDHLTNLIYMIFLFQLNLLCTNVVATLRNIEPVKFAKLLDVFVKDTLGVGKQ